MPLACHLLTGASAPGRPAVIVALLEEDGENQLPEQLRWRAVITSILAMSDEVRQIVPEDEEITEEWVRETDEPGIRNVGAFTGPEIDGWVVSIWAQEFFRQDALGAELRQRMERALRAVAEVIDVHEQNNEQWDVTGAPSGEALTRAAATVVDELADRMRQAMSALDRGEVLP